MNSLMKILFLCEANSSRSQMAEGIGKKILGRKHQIKSAGSKPASSVNPNAVEALSEIGINITPHKPKTLKALPASFLKDLDYIITLCGEETCPTIKVKSEKLHWPLLDPARENTLDAFREARDEIKRHIESLKEVLE